MAAITDRDSLAAAITDWSVRDEDTDQLIALAEAEFRLYFGPNFAKDETTTLAFTSGSATLPTGYVRTLALTHATYGALEAKTIGQIRQRRVWDASGIPDIFAITGTTVEVAPSYTGDLTFDYEGTLTGLSDVNATNWLITNAPQAYLAMCLSMAKARVEEFDAAALYKAQAMQTLNDLGIQSMVAQYGRSSVTIAGCTP